MQVAIDEAEINRVFLKYRQPDNGYDLNASLHRTAAETGYPLAVVTNVVLGR